MSPTLSQKILRLISPKQEKERMEFRMLLNRSMANAEDLTVNIKRMNGHLLDHIEQWKKK